MWESTGINSVLTRSFSFFGPLRNEMEQNRIVKICCPGRDTLNRGAMRAGWVCRNQMYRRFVQGCREVRARFAGVCLFLWRKNIMLVVGRTGEVT